MSTDLIQAFFERDLTETEKDELGRQLKADPAATERFSALASAKYAATGLPEPRWPGESGISLPLPLKVAAAVLLAGGLAWLACKGPEVLGPRLCPDASDRPVVDVSSLPANAAPPAVAPAVRGARKAGPANATTPESFVEGRRYTGLLAVVDKGQEAPTRVRVTDAAGREVRVLYDGILPKGTWVFRWDGRLESGEASKAGSYTIEVISAGKTLRSPVRLGPH